MTLPVSPGSAWKFSPTAMAAELERGAYVRAPHILHVEREVIRAMNTPRGRLIVELPPQHGKTWLLRRSLAWFLNLNPWARLLYRTYGGNFAGELGGKTRDYIEEHADRLRVQIRKDSREEAAWETTEGGGLWSASTTGPMTGRTGDGILVDDPLKGYQDAHSLTIRERVWNEHLAVALTRVTPRAWVIVVGTRWHEDDLIGRLIAAGTSGQGDVYRVVRLPAVAEEDDPMGRAEGAPLAPGPGFGRDEEFLRLQRQALGPYLFGALYQQNPHPPEGSILMRSWWRYWRALPAMSRLDEWLISWDMTFKDSKASDYVVGQVWARSGADKYLVDQVRGQMDYPSTKRAVQALAAKWPQARRIIVEDKANGPAILSDLRSTVSGLVPYSPTDSKEARVHAISGDVEARNVWLPEPGPEHPWVVDLVEEAAAFPNGTHDDQVDAMSQALIHWSNALAAGVGSYGGRRRR